MVCSACLPLVVLPSFILLARSDVDLTLYIILCDLDRIVPVLISTSGFILLRSCRNNV